MRKLQALTCAALAIVGVVLLASAAAAAALGLRPDHIKTPENEKVTFNVLANDSPPPGDRLDPTSLNINTFPDSGDLDLSLSARFTYTPSPGFQGADSFSYFVCAKKHPNECATETVDITVGNPQATTTTTTTVAPAPPPSASPAAAANALPRTGSTTSLVLAAGVALCAMGALMLGASRVRTRRTE